MAVKKHLHKMGAVTEDQVKSRRRKPKKSGHGVGFGSEAKAWMASSEQLAGAARETTLELLFGVVPACGLAAPAEPCKRLSRPFSGGFPPVP
jgi:hypothetical protein